jgi:transposase
MVLRLGFVTLAMRERANISALCHRFDISRTTGYKWIHRYKAEGKEERSDRSRRPRLPNKTPDRVEETACAVCRQHPGWQVVARRFIFTPLRCGPLWANTIAPANW